MLFVIGLISTHYLTYFSVGLAQQKLYQLTNDDPFRYTFALTVIASSCNVMFGILMLWAEKGFSTSKLNTTIKQRLAQNKILRKDYILVSLTFMIGKVAGNHSLTLVDYATQALAKCAKPVSVVLLGICHFGMRFKTADVTCSIWIVASLLAFNLCAINSSKAKPKVSSTIQGNILLLVSLFCDGLTGARLDHLVAKIRATLPMTCHDLHRDQDADQPADQKASALDSMDAQVPESIKNGAAKQPTETTCVSYELMCTINFLTVVYAVVMSLIFEGPDSIRYFVRNPGAVPPLAIFSIVGALGQLCTFKCVSYLGALQTSTITATRKIVMVLVSVYWFNTFLVPTQWLAVASIGCAVMWRASLAYNKKDVLGKLRYKWLCWRCGSKKRESSIIKEIILDEDKGVKLNGSSKRGCAYRANSAEEVDEKSPMMSFANRDSQETITTYQDREKPFYLNRTPSHPDLRPAAHNNAFENEESRIIQPHGNHLKTTRSFGSVPC